MSNEPVSPVATRSAVTLRIGSKVCILVALVALAAAVYFYFVPSTLRTQTGGVFDCGSPGHPIDNGFAQNVCLNVTDVDRYRSYLLLAVGLIVGILGTVLFGVDRRQVERRPRGYISEDGQFQPGSSAQSTDESTGDTTGEATGKATTERPDAPARDSA